MGAKQLTPLPWPPSHKQEFDRKQLVLHGLNFMQAKQTAVIVPQPSQAAAAAAVAAGAAPGAGAALAGAAFAAEGGLSKGGAMENLDRALGASLAGVAPFTPSK